MSFFTVSTEFHIFTWATALILFFVLVLAKQKIRPLHLTLHIFYLLVILSGTVLVLEAMNYGHALLYAMKFFIGAALILVMELLLLAKQRQQPLKIYWLLIFVFFSAIAWIGLALPMGYYL